MHAKDLPGRQMKVKQRWRFEGRRVGDTKQEWRFEGRLTKMRIRKMTKKYKEMATGS